MDYLYLPTTTLNFNNILSTGSISPAAVYSVRQFGFRQFELVEPNPFRNLLLLYDRYPEFTIEDSERDNYPMVFRIRTERLSGSLNKHASSKGDVTVYACSETIYFDLASTEILFPSRRAQQVALTKSEQNLTTKLVDLYKSSMRVPVKGEFATFVWSQLSLAGIKDGDDSTVLKCCENDRRINRLKGFAFGYILGAYQSNDPKVARIRSYMREIINDCSARMNDPALDVPRDLRTEIDYSCSTLEKFYAKVGLGSQRFVPDMGDCIRIEKGAIEAVFDRHENVAVSLNRFVRFVNEYSLRSDFYDQLDEQRLQVALDGAKAIIAIIGDKWSGSEYQNYINALLNNIKSGSAFDFKKTTSLTLQSFAAFLLKGDDMQKLEAFLTSQSIGDFRIAFALWGAMFGFSKLPKTLFNLPIEQNDFTYLARIYAYVHRVVHGIPAKELLKTDKKDPPPLEILDELKTAHPKSEPWLPQINRLLSSSGGLNKKFMDALKKIKPKELGGAVKGLPVNKVVKFFNDSLEGAHRTPPKPKEPELELALYETPHQAAVTKEKETITASASLDLVKMPESPMFVDDTACIGKLVQPNVGNLSLTKRKAVAASLREFQIGFRPGGYYSDRPETYQRDNSNAVDHFICCLSSNKTPKLQVSLTGEERTALEEWLRVRYGC